MRFQYETIIKHQTQKHYMDHPLDSVGGPGDNLPN